MSLLFASITTSLSYKSDWFPCRPPSSPTIVAHHRRPGYPSSSSPTVVACRRRPPSSPTVVTHHRRPSRSCLTRSRLLVTCRHRLPSLPTVITHLCRPLSSPTVVAHRCHPPLLPTVIAHLRRPPSSPVRLTSYLVRLNLHFHDHYPVNTCLSRIRLQCLNDPLS